VAIGRLLGGEFQIAVGAPAPAATLLTVRTSDDAYRIAVGRPIGTSAKESLKGFLLSASEQMLQQHEAVVRSTPDQWRGWKDWLKRGKTKREKRVACRGARVTGCCKKTAKVLQVHCQKAAKACAF
jgi:hypothetical protein